MKKILLILLLSFPLIAISQITTINPDTVCYQTSGSIYQVLNVPGDTYTWTVAAPGVIVSGQGSSSIEVDWSSASPGLIATGVSVFPTNQFGCVGPTVTLDVFIYNEIPVVTPLTFCLDEPCTDLIANPVGGSWSGPGVVGAQFCPQIAGVGTHVVTYTYTIGECVFVVTGVMTVNPLPTISPIGHN
jgi:hypothetical protein